MDQSFFALPRLVPKNNKVEGSTTQITIPGTNNICPSDFSAWETGQYSQTTGAKEVLASRIRLKSLIRILPSTVYYFDTASGFTGFKFVVRTYDANGTFVRSVGTVNNKATVTTSATEYYFSVSMYYSLWDVAFEEYAARFADGTIKPFICLNSETDKIFKAYSPARPNKEAPILLTNILQPGSYACTDAMNNVYKATLPLMLGLDIKDTYTIGQNVIQSNVVNVALDGTEAWSLQGTNTAGVISFSLLVSNEINQFTISVPSLCTHLSNNVAALASAQKQGFFIQRTAGGTTLYIRLFQYEVPDLATFKTWLAVQKAAGKTVTLQYEKASPSSVAIASECVWEKPVVDRVATDCVYGNPKGCLDAAVMNRLDKNIKYIKAYMDYLHVDYSALITRDTEWSRDLYLRVAEINRIQRNINNIYNAKLRQSDTQPIVLSIAEEYLRYELLNHMEQLLLDAKNILDNMVAAFLHTGDSHCGMFEIGG